MVLVRVEVPEAMMMMMMVVVVVTAMMMVMVAVVVLGTMRGARRSTGNEGGRSHANPDYGRTHIHPVVRFWSMLSATHAKRQLRSNFGGL